MDPNNVNLEDLDIDSFIPSPDAETIVTAGDDKKKTPSNLFSRSAGEDLGFLEDEETEEGEEGKTSVKDVSDTLADLDQDLDNPEDKEKTTSRRRSDPTITTTLSKLFEKGTLIPFEDEKPLEEYTAKDIEELIQANIDDKVNAVKEQTPKEFFESLPEEMQYAAKYIMDGGTDMKSLFRALSEVEQTRQLDAAEPADQEIIVRQYLQATGFGDADEIDEQIELYKNSNALEKWALKHKPKLDSMQEQVIQQKLDAQAEAKKKQIETRDKYMTNVYNVLKPGEINGIKLDNKSQKFYWDEMTESKYQSMNGRQTNLLGHLLEKYQFGETPRYDLILEATMLLNDPEAYREKIASQATSKQAVETARKLKTEESRKLANNTPEENEEKPAVRKLTRKNDKNFFQRS